MYYRKGLRGRRANKTLPSRKHPRRARQPKYRRQSDPLVLYRYPRYHEHPFCPDCGAALVGAEDTRGLASGERRTFRRRCYGCKRRWKITVQMRLYGRGRELRYERDRNGTYHRRRRGTVNNHGRPSSPYIYEYN